MRLFVPPVEIERPWMLTRCLLQRGIGDHQNTRGAAAAGVPRPEEAPCVILPLLPPARGDGADGLLQWHVASDHNATWAVPGYV